MSNETGIPGRNLKRQPPKLREGKRQVDPLSPTDFAASSSSPLPSQTVNGSVKSRSPRSAEYVNASPAKPKGAASSFTEPFRDRHPTPSPKKKRGFLQRLFRALRRLLIASKNWFKSLLKNSAFLLTAGFFTCISTAVLATAFLFQLPGLPNCPAVFWPLASASMRFECARIAASKQTAKDLLEAIALVDGLPANHEMRAEADRLIELWSQEVLKLADELFHQGKLDEAIAAARKIPAKTTAHELIEERVTRWQTTWNKAEQFYQKAETALRKRNWKQAFQYAVRLLDIDNRYWQTTRYDDLNKRINIAREDGNKLFKAEWLADAGDLTSLLKAIKLAEEIRPESYIYELAQEKIQEFGKKMLDLAQAALDRRDLQTTLSIIDQIPKRARLEEEKKDYTILANAQSQAWQDTVAGIEGAISQAQRIQPNRPLYQKAQQMIVSWQYEIEGLAQIERARLLAQSGTPEALLSAIASASQISSSNPRWKQAQKQIQTWQAQIQNFEDQPILDQADQFASAGDVMSLQSAIAQADQIQPGRSMYQEARRKIRQWTSQIQQIQDQPILDQARAYAFAGNIQGAISIAQQIRSGRALYDEAQADIAKWQGQIQAEMDRAQAQQNQAQAQQNLQAARQMASVGTPTALGNAIRLVSQVSASGTAQTEVTSAINEWSWQLLQLAKEQAFLSPANAIAIAQRIPSRADSYTEAQTHIATWKKATGQ